MATIESEVKPLHPTLDRIQFPALIVGVVGLVLCAIGWVTNADGFYRAYLFAYLFWLGLALGSYALLMLQHVTGGAWGFILRRFLEAGARMIPLMAVLFIPILLGMSHLYVWTHPEHRGHIDHFGFKSWWLSSDMFILRAVIYFAIWIAYGTLLTSWSAAQDRSDDPRIGRRLQIISGPGILLYGLSITFASVDWVMSIDPHWYSTIYGVLFVVGQGLSTLCVGVALLALMYDRKPMAGLVNVGHFHDLGNLMLAFTMLWAYVNYSQFLIVWMGNIAEETPFYAYRSQGGWLAITVILIVFHFAVPFVMLLMRRTKRTVSWLRTLALFILVMRFVDLFWVTRPTFNQANVRPPEPIPTLMASIHWLDFVTPFAIGGIFIFVFIWQLRKHPVLPLHDPRLQELAHAHGSH